MYKSWGSRLGHMSVGWSTEGFGQGNLKCPPCLIQTGLNGATLRKGWEHSGKVFHSSNSKSRCHWQGTSSPLHCVLHTANTGIPKTSSEHLALVHPAVRPRTENKIISTIIHNRECCAFFGQHTSSSALGKSRDTPWFTPRAWTEPVELETSLWWQTGRFLNMYFNLWSCTELPHPIHGLTESQIWQMFH